MKRRLVSNLPRKVDSPEFVHLILDKFWLLDLPNLGLLFRRVLSLRHRNIGATWRARRPGIMTFCSFKHQCG